MPVKPDFRKITADSIQRGFRVIPVVLGTKHPPLDLKDWPRLATKSLDKVEAWIKQYGNELNAGDVASLDTCWHLDVDDATWLLEQVKLPTTYAIRTGNQAFRLRLSFLHNADTRQRLNQNRKLGNPRYIKDGPEPPNLLELQSHDQHSVAAGSVHMDSGRLYEVWQDLPVVAADDSFLEWLLRQFHNQKSSRRTALINSLKESIDVEKELGQAGLKFEKAERQGLIYFDYQVLMGKCLVRDELHVWSGNEDNNRCSSFVYNPQTREFYHSCFTAGCKLTPNQTRIALQRLGIDLDDWLARDATLLAKGRPLVANALRVLRNSDEWRRALGFNLFSARVEVTQVPPIPRYQPNQKQWIDQDDLQLAIWLQEHSLPASTQIAHDAALALAQDQSYHPLKDYLNSLKWDRKPRLTDWLTTYLGAEATEYTRAVGPRWMISAVARVMEPGCQADHVLLLIGRQGMGKSSALQILAVRPEWFLDHLPKLEDKDSRLVLLGRWIVEDSEFQPRPHNLEVLKNFVTDRIDTFRKPYGRVTEDVPRTCVLAATTNSSTPLVDETGNRRFWPVDCHTINRDQLLADRDQLWAEAVQRYYQKEEWWLDAQRIELAEREQVAHAEFGLYHDEITAWVENPCPREGSDPAKLRSTPERVTIEEVLEHVLNLNREDEKWNKGTRNEVGKTFRKLGWKPGVTLDLPRVRCFIKPLKNEPEELRLIKETEEM